MRKDGEAPIDYFSSIVEAECAEVCTAPINADQALTSDDVVIPSGL
jgi:hypothetical protein